MQRVRVSRSMSVMPKDPKRYMRKHRIPMPNCGEPTRRGGICPNPAAIVKLRGKHYKLKTCVMHAPKAIKDELGISDPPRGNVGRKKKQTASQILRDRFEAEADRYLQPFEDAIEAMKAVVVGNGASAHVEMYEDFALRLKACNDLLDRIYGRPKQVTEFSGVDGDAIEVSVPNDDERKQALAAVLASTGALGPVIGASIPKNSSASAPSTN